MFKKIEVWVVLILMFISLLFTIVFGALVRHEILAPKSQLPRISKAALFIAEMPSNINRILNGMNSDLRLDNRFPSTGGFQGIGNDFDSYLLLSRYSGEKQESIVELIDLKDFKKIHEWNPDIDKLNSLITNPEEFTNLKRDRNNRRFNISHPLFFKDGSIVFHGGGTALTKIDQCSKLIWQNSEDRFHHSIETDDEGYIFVPVHIYPFHVNKKYIGNSIENYFDDGIAKISEDGSLIYKKSISNIFIENNMHSNLFAMSNGEFNEDPIHLNDIQPLLNDTVFGSKGDLLLSLRHQSMIILYRPSSNEIVWQSSGNMIRQHDVDILDSERISIFNNNSPLSFNGEIVDGHNEVLIYNFKNSKISKYLNDSIKRNDIRTISGGTSQILDNGDLFIEETNYGRSVYINSDGSLRWQHVNQEKNSVYGVTWSRILYKDSDIANVKNFLSNKSNCNQKPF